MAEAFYEIDGGRYVATELTRGPWDPGAQHAGPPAALLGRAVEQLEDAAEFQVGRITFEILRPVPIAPVRVSAEVVRAGRRVQLVEATLADESGEPLMRASAWRIRTAPVDLPSEARADDDPPPGPEQGAEAEFFPTGQDAGYHTAMEVRFVEGSFLEPGPATVWLRMRRPLVSGEQPSPLQRTLVAADVGKRRQRHPRLPPLPLHQRRPHRSPGADAGRRVGLRRRGHPAAAERDRHRRVGPQRRRGPNRPSPPDPPRSRTPLSAAPHRQLHQILNPGDREFDSVRGGGGWFDPVAGGDRQGYGRHCDYGDRGA